MRLRYFENTCERSSRGRYFYAKIKKVHIPSKWLGNLFPRLLENRYAHVICVKSLFTSIQKQ